MNKSFAGFFFLIVVGLGISGCGSDGVKSEQSSAPPINAAANSANSNSAAIEDTKKEGTHEHSAPHGGTLIVFGDEVAHVELVLDQSTGKLTAYVLDGEAEKGVPIAQESIDMDIERPRSASLKLLPVENSLTGEKAGSTSQFSMIADELKGLSDFDAKIKSLNVKGREFRNVHFNFPKGNEKDHNH